MVTFAVCAWKAFYNLMSTESSFCIRLPWWIDHSIGAPLVLPKITYWIEQTKNCRSGNRKQSFLSDSSGFRSNSELVEPIFWNTPPPPPHPRVVSSPAPTSSPASSENRQWRGALTESSPLRTCARATALCSYHPSFTGSIKAVRSKQASVATCSCWLYLLAVKSTLFGLPTINQNERL